MSRLVLFATILLIVCIQAGAFAAIAIRRRRREPARLVTMPPAAPPSTGGTPAWPGLREFRVARRTPENESGTIVSLHLAPVDGQPLPPYRPGQYLTVQLPASAGSNPAGRPIVRCYSLSDAHDAAGYRVSVRRVMAPGDRSDLSPGVASGWIHEHVREGDILPLRAPAGHFHLDPGGTGPVVLIGGGIGMTPVLAMARTVARHPSPRAAWLFVSARDGRDLPFRSELDEMARTARGPRLVRCLSRPRPEDVPGETYEHAGHIDVELLRRTLPPEALHFYVCGPPPLMEELVPALETWGVPPERIHFEAFGPASVRRLANATPPAEPAEPVRVRFERSGRDATWDGSFGTLLDLAESNGIDVPTGCRAGSCGTCSTRLASGDVTYASPPDFEPEAGTCLPCVATPRSDVQLIL